MKESSVQTIWNKKSRRLILLDSLIIYTLLCITLHNVYCLWVKKKTLKTRYIYHIKILISKSRENLIDENGASLRFSKEKQNKRSW